MFLENLRCAYRNLRKSPGFALTAILSLGIGIGGTVCMFTLVNSILLKPLQYREPNQLVLITQTGPDRPSYLPTFGIAPIEFLRWRDGIQSFESLSLMTGATVNVTGSAAAQMLGAARISAEFFDTLGVNPQLGRWFRREEEKRGMPAVAVISADLWRRLFSADPNVVGKKILLDGVPHEVVGVTPPGLRFFRGQQLHVEYAFSQRTDVFLPLRFTLAEEQGRPMVVYLGIGRLKAGATLGQARAELDGALRTVQFNPPPSSWGANGPLPVLQPLQSALVTDGSKALWLLLAAVGFVLLIACVNVANLSLMRSARRTHELAVRVALGAARRDLLRYLLAESLLLSLAGTVVGVAISIWIRDGVVAFAPTQLPRLDEVSVDRAVFLFAAVVCVFTTALFGVFPAWRASRVDPREALGAAGRGATETRRSGRIRAALISAEVTLATLLAIASGLLMVSLHKVMDAPKGFTAEHVMVADFTLPTAKYQTVPSIERFFRGLRDELAPTPGVVHIAATRLFPLNPENFAPVLTEDSEGIGSAQARLVTWPAVTSEYFRAMGIALREGRFFYEGETDDVAVVSQSAARMLWPGEDPIGKRISRDESIRKWLRVVGVAGDVLSAGLDRPSTPAIYRSYSQYGTAAFTLVVRTAKLDDFDKALRRAVANVDGDVPVPEVHTVSELIGKSTQQRRFQMVLFMVFAATAMLLAAIGVYGVVAYSVAQRRREIGLRVALGADTSDVVRLMFQYGMVPVLFGLAGGVGTAVFLSKAMASLLFDIAPFDPVIFIAATIISASSGTLACLISAPRALRIDPSLCLRVE